ncbi:UbiD family decarboxylase [Geomonas subterranea]|uniref:UbiD family decarboxylase n=1 Tax=Geomonas subterranea TaxID=2847989 RepID=A0ABX8LSA6_9BACT|nr:UbiD family decarboxylase [Geomonas subterranea]QXE92385.1 UbiD family decarboxylase [Geomonas subterranea]QXM09516.1 UbiD family decarboxylase [Geomonas subterranea]
MGYKDLASCVADLERTGALVRIDCEVSSELEIGSIQRRVYQAGGPALLFTRVEGSSFPMLGNLFGTLERTRYIFRDTLKAVERLVKLKVDPRCALREPATLAGAVPAAWHLLPKNVSDGPILANRTSIDKLPQLKSWPDDGGAFITLPQVYSESALQPGLRHSNLGMYRVQLSGGEYRENEEIGLHYQIHRGIGFHHAEAIAKGEPFRVNIFVGGAPSMTVAAVMPLPEGMPELSFAGLLAGHRIEMVRREGKLPMPAQADFCITGVIDPTKTLPEGPFGDHFGYYSLAHHFPVLKVEEVFHRDGAIWPFTTVGRPPQEDTSFGAFIHELTGPLIPTVIPGVKAVHAVDAAGVHPLLFAMGSERYVPYGERRTPQELLTIANAVLGQGQLSLAKYLMIAAHEDAPRLDIHDIPAFLGHVLERIDLRRDLHFQTATTMDTLDYSGSGLNSGSKVVFAAIGEKRRSLGTELPPGLRLAPGFSEPALCLPGVVAVQGPACRTLKGEPDVQMEALCAELEGVEGLEAFPLIVVCDDSRFTAAELNNFLWVTFTRSDPAADIYGVGASTVCKQWGCRGPLIIDARIKPHHAPPLIEDPAVEKRVDQLAAPGGPLHGLY